MGGLFVAPGSDGDSDDDCPRICLFQWEGLSGMSGNIELTFQGQTGLGPADALVVSSHRRVHRHDAASVCGPTCGTLCKMNPSSTPSTSTGNTIDNISRTRSTTTSIPQLITETVVVPSSSSVGLTSSVGRSITPQTSEPVTSGKIIMNSSRLPTT